MALSPWAAGFWPVAAQVDHRAFQHKGKPRLADVRPVQDQQWCASRPEGLGRHAVELQLDVERVSCRRQDGAVADPEDVGVDRERLLAEGGVEHDVGGLAATPAAPRAPGVCGTSSA